MRWLPLLLAAPVLAAPVAWDVRDSRHPTLGDIRYAYTHRPIETQAGSATVYSRAYFSCQKGVGKLALELVSATAPAEPVGLRPSSEPRLLCHRSVEGRIETEPLLATWEVNDKSGHVLTRGLRPFPLRECATIGVIHEVALPAGAGPKTARAEFELRPSSIELDPVFAACGERPAGAATQAAALATFAPAGPAEPPRAVDSWRSARVIATGKTNVRARPTLGSAIVARLAPGSVVRVRQGEGEWWEARPAKGAAFEGYIRDDRLVFSREGPPSPGR